MMTLLGSWFDRGPAIPPLPAYPPPLPPHVENPLIKPEILVRILGFVGNPKITDRVCTLWLQVRADALAFHAERYRHYPVLQDIFADFSQVSLSERADKLVSGVLENARTFKIPVVAKAETNYYSVEFLVPICRQIDAHNRAYNLAFLCQSIATAINHQECAKPLLEEGLAFQVRTEKCFTWLTEKRAAIGNINFLHLKSLWRLPQEINLCINLQRLAVQCPDLHQLPATISLKRVAHLSLHEKTALSPQQIVALCKSLPALTEVHVFIPMEDSVAIEISKQCPTVTFQLFNKETDEVTTISSETP